MFKQVFVYNIFYKLGWFALSPFFFTYPLNKSRFMTQQNLKRILEAILKMAFLKVSAPEIVSATTAAASLRLLPLPTPLLYLWLRWLYPFDLIKFSIITLCRGTLAITTP